MIIRFDRAEHFARCADHRDPFHVSKRQDAIVLQENHRFFGSFQSECAVRRRVGDGWLDRVISGSSVTYTPNSGFSGLDSFTFNVTDSTNVAGPLTIAVVTVNLVVSATGVTPSLTLICPAATYDLHSHGCTTVLTPSFWVQPPSAITVRRHSPSSPEVTPSARALLIAAPANILRSPWDGKTVKTTDAAYRCPAIPHIAPDLVTDGFYRLDDPTHSIVDPARMEAYRKSSDGVKIAGMAIVRTADDYRSSGSQQAAQCAMSRLVTMARDKSLSGKMSSTQAYYVQGWVVGAVAIAYLKVRETSDATPEQTESITKWLHSVGEQTKGYYDEQKKLHGNNHLYWAGVELAAIGVAANHRGDFDWAMQTYDNGVAQLQPDGTLPLEMARGSKALH